MVLKRAPIWLKSYGCAFSASSGHIGTCGWFGKCVDLCASSSSEEGSYSLKALALAHIEKVVDDENLQVGVKFDLPDISFHLLSITSLICIHIMIPIHCTPTRARSICEQANIKFMMPTKRSKLSYQAISVSYIKDMQKNVAQSVGFHPPMGESQAAEAFTDDASSRKAFYLNNYWNVTDFLVPLVFSVLKACQAKKGATKATTAKFLEEEVVQHLIVGLFFKFRKEVGTDAGRCCRSGSSEALRWRAWKFVWAASRAEIHPKVGFAKCSRRAVRSSGRTSATTSGLWKEFINLQDWIGHLF